MSQDMLPNGEEQLITTFSTHWIKYVRPTAVYVILLPISILLFFLAGLSAHHSKMVSDISFIAGLILLLLVHHWYFQRLLSEAMVDLIVTNKRIIYLRSSLYLSDDMREFSMDRVIAVEATVHGPLQNILRYGSIWVDTGGSDSADTGSTIPQIPHPHSVAKAISQAHNLK